MTFGELVADRLATSSLSSDPIAWAERQGIWLWDKPREILESVERNRLTVVHAGHGISKSHTGAVAAGWWIDTRHRLGTVRVVTTADTGAQVRGVLWQEINRLHVAAKLPGRVNQTEWWIGSDMVGLGRKPADYDPAAFQGFHAEYVLVIIDEIAGVPVEIIEAARSLASGDECRILALGNPDFSGSTFDRICQPGGPWNVIHMDVLDSPNFTNQPVPAGVARALTSKAWVDDLASEFGEDSAVYQAKVRGLFPSDQSDGVVRWSALNHCRGRLWSEKDLYPVELGVDVGAGGDQSVVRERRGPKVGRVWRDRQPDTMRVVGLVQHALEETGATSVKVDKTGIGQGVFDRLKEIQREGGIPSEVTILGVMVGEGSRYPHRFVNLRAEIWWEIGRELSESGGWDFGDAEDPEAAMAQLCAPKYHFNSSGRTVIEPKSETKKRLGKSPDDADALLLAFYRTSAGPATTSVGQMAGVRLSI